MRSTAGSLMFSAAEIMTKRASLVLAFVSSTSDCQVPGTTRLRYFSTASTWSAPPESTVTLAASQ